MDKQVVWNHKSDINFNKYFAVVWKTVPMPLTRTVQGLILHATGQMTWHWSCLQPRTHCPLNKGMSGCLVGMVPGRGRAAREWICTSQDWARAHYVLHSHLEPDRDLCPACFLFTGIDTGKRLYPAKTFLPLKTLFFFFLKQQKTRDSNGIVCALAELRCVWGWEGFPGSWV